MAENAQELFEHELKDIYDAEHKLVKALAKMAKDVEDEKLSQGFEQHRQVTEGQIERLEQVFELLDTRAERQPCAGIDGLIREYTKFVREEKPEGPVLDVFATGAAKKVEHYEIVAYKGLIELAEQLDLSEAAELLQQSLREEEQTAQKLERIGKQLGQQLATASAERA
ncbi:MAG: ferritin-like domain-containing protein [Gemmatimonadota bacterium]